MIYDDDYEPRPWTAGQQAENRAKWVAALRSGEYQQGKQELRTDQGSYCCLGVACVVAIADGVEDRWPDDGGFTWDEQLPRSVRDWLGLASRAGDLVAEIEGRKHLIALNDDAEFTFAQIASVIEQGKVKLASTEVTS